MRSLPEKYNHKEVEPRIYKLWEEGGYFTPQPEAGKRNFSVFLPPPNASGGMHIGNVFMIALQDILVRYHRAKGDATTWIPGTDHGGYETQVTFEREFEKAGKKKSDYRKKELFQEIKTFAEHNNEVIKKQIKVMGASVDWSRFRYTMDDSSQKLVDQTFRKLVADKLMYRRSYMVNYCFHCGTVLADIELSERKAKTPLYYIKFPFEGSSEYLSLATPRPEFLFATTHVLVSPSDKRYASHIGKRLTNPITGTSVAILGSKRKWDPEKAHEPLSAFCPSYKRYDYEYTLRNTIPSKNLLDWNGKMIERYPGLTPLQAREKEVEFLTHGNHIEKADETYEDSVFLCKSGHAIESKILLTWFLKIDDEKKSLRKPAVEALKRGGLSMYPAWRSKALVEWMEKMHDWPIARQNVWGIRMPIWYELVDPSLFMVWFIDASGGKKYGNLKTFLDAGISLAEIKEGLEQVYASEEVPWAIDPQEGKEYLQDTDTFDTWFSSGQWATIIFGGEQSEDFKRFYPSHSLITGHDLLRLFASRTILLSMYLTGKLPYRNIYLHHLIKGKDGQKMSKSLGNAVNPEEYLNQFGADVTRMALISYSHISDDFIFEDERLQVYKKFGERLWTIGQRVPLAREYAVPYSASLPFSEHDKKILSTLDLLGDSLGSYIDKFMFSQAQQKVCDFLGNIEAYMREIQTHSPDPRVSLSVLLHVYDRYLLLLHPFMPFLTEELHTALFDEKPLTSLAWPSRTPSH